MKTNEGRLILGVVLLLIVQLVILVGAYLGGLLRSNNCWDQYQTEQQAIENCEKTNG